jgi:hypothetical protein
MEFPETFDVAPPLTCGAWYSDEPKCDKDATWHVIISSGEDGLNDTICCDEHKAKLDQIGAEFLMAHPYKLDCSSELAYFFPDLNECFIGDPDADGV